MGAKEGGKTGQSAKEILKVNKTYWNKKLKIKKKKLVLTEQMISISSTT